jgi:hypothetical protein
MANFRGTTLVAVSFHRLFESDNSSPLTGATVFPYLAQAFQEICSGVYLHILIGVCSHHPQTLWLTFESHLKVMPNRDIFLSVMAFGDSTTRAEMMTISFLEVWVQAD